MSGRVDNARIPAPGPGLEEPKAGSTAAPSVWRPRGTSDWTSRSVQSLARIIHEGAGTVRCSGDQPRRTTARGAGKACRPLTGDGRRVDRSQRGLRNDTEPEAASVGRGWGQWKSGAWGALSGPGAQGEGDALPSVAVGCAAREVQDHAPHGDDDVGAQLEQAVA